MKHQRRAAPGVRASAVRGFTLVELMIAVLISLFLAAGLLTLVQAMKKTSGVQSGLSQLQDSERVAMTLIADVIQSAGYFPNPTANTGVSMFPVVAPYTFAGQTIAGTGNWGDPAPGNSITVRYATGGTAVVAPLAPDNTVNCTGNMSPNPTSHTVTAMAAPPLVPPCLELFGRS